MKLDIAFKEIESTEALETHIRTAATQIERLVAPDEHVHVVVGAKTKGQQHHAEVTWHCNRSGKDFHAKAEGHNLYSQIDEVFEKVYRQAQEARDRVIDERRQAKPHKKMPVP
jgi:ribosomal subunit interface protein